jgi:hypothetical protein
MLPKQIDFTKDWCVRMAQMEMDAGSDMEIGATPEAAITPAAGMRRRQKPLLTRLRAARLLLREWRRTIYDSERDRTLQAPNDLSPEAAGELARFDAADTALAEAIKLVLSVPQSPTSPAPEGR